MTRSAWNACGPFSRTRTRFTTGGVSFLPRSRRAYSIAPDGQLCASSATSSAFAFSGWIHSPSTFGTNTSGRSSTQLREWMQREPWKWISTSLLRTTSTSLMGGFSNPSVPAPVRDDHTPRGSRAADSCMRLHPSVIFPMSRRSASFRMAGVDHLDIYSDLDQRLVAATRGIRLLQSVSWPASIEMDFVSAWKAGTARLPEISYPRFDFAETREALMGISIAAEPGHPLGDYIRRTAHSWRVATELLDAIGTPAITEHSARLFGRPSDRVPGAKLTNVDAARHFIAIADEFISAAELGDNAETIPADQLREALQRQLDEFFGVGVVRVETDPDLIAKAAAGATRIRL